MCNVCNGNGSIIDNPCKKCNGSKVERSRNTIKTGIPKGVHSGDILNIEGAGNYYPKENTYSALHVFIKVLDNELFKIHQYDLHCVAPITLDQAIFGGKIELPTPHGLLQVTIPKKTKHGDILKIEGKGMKKRMNADNHGDLYIIISIDIPDADNKLKRALQSKNIKYNEVERFTKMLQDIEF